jgi:hypothetical protein
MTADQPGMPKPIKLQEQHRALFPLDRPLGEESGRLIAEWANGTSAPKLSALDAAIKRFGELGITVEALEKRIGHAPLIESDLPELTKYGKKIAADKAAKNDVPTNGETEA